MRPAALLLLLCAGDSFSLEPQKHSAPEVVSYRWVQNPAHPAWFYLYRGEDTLLGAWDIFALEWHEYRGGAWGEARKEAPVPPPVRLMGPTETSWPCRT
jgi:hypothetical protein